VIIAPWASPGGSPSIRSRSLGRFADQRKAILDALREELRNRNLRCRRQIGPPNYKRDQRAGR
jgi:hypothetical protein